MTTIDDRPAAPLMTPDSARRAAVAFIAEGITAAAVRETEDSALPAPVRAQLAEAMDAMNGLTPEDAQFLLGGALVPSAA